MEDGLGEVLHAVFDGGAQELGVFFVGLVVAGAACFAEEAAVVLGVAEVLGGEGLLADELEAEAVCEGTDGFEEVTGEGFAAVAGLVVVADGGVESGGVEGDGDFGACEGRDFVGKAALLALKEKGVAVKQVGLLLDKSGILRAHMEVLTGFNITPASEIMAILCLAENFSDLKRRIGNIYIGKKIRWHFCFCS